MPELSQVEKSPEREHFHSAILFEKWRVKFEEFKKRAQAALVNMEKNEEDQFSAEILKAAINFLKISIKEYRIIAEKLAVSVESLKKQYPAHVAEIDLLFDVVKMQVFPKKLKRELRQKQQGVGGTENTEYFVHLTKFIYKNKNRPNEMKKFWERHEMIYSVFLNFLGRGYGARFDEAERVGMVGQAAAFHLLNKLGFEASLATPEEDALESTDLWIWMPTDLAGSEEDFPLVERGISIQIKASKNLRKIEKLKIELDDAIHYPSLQISSEKLPADKDIFVSNASFDDIPHLAEKVETKESRNNKKISALRVEIPYQESFINLDTGVPTQKCVEDAKKEFDKIFKTELLTKV